MVGTVEAVEPLPLCGRHAPEHRVLIELARESLEPLNRGPEALSLAACIQPRCRQIDLLHLQSARYPREPEGQLASRWAEEPTSQPRELSRRPLHRHSDRRLQVTQDLGE